MTMARLATVEKGQWSKFERDLDARMGAEELVSLNQNPDVLDEMLALMRQRLFGVGGHSPLVGPVVDVSAMMIASQHDLSDGRVDEGMTAAGIAVAIDLRGYRFATPAEQLAWVEGTWNGRDMVVAIGSSCLHPHDSRRYVPCLCAERGPRPLSLHWVKSNARWDEDWRFLIVRK